jgi:hypothetical protein
MLKTLLLIVSHQNSQHERRELTHEDFICHYFVGDKEIKDEFQVDEESNTVRLRVADNYESLSEKVALAMKFAHDVYGEFIDGVFKTDDDISLDLELLSKFIKDNKKHKYFGIKNNVEESLSDYHFNKCESKEINNTRQIIPACEYCSGGGYYVSKELLCHIFGQKPVSIFEDANVGKILNDAGVRPKHVPIKACAFWQSPVSLRMKSMFPHCDCGLIIRSELNFCPHCDRMYRNKA